MGQELECTMRQGKRAQTGKAQLETDYLLFRGDDRLKLLFKDITTARAADGVLHVEFGGGAADFELGRAAEQWADKILHPPSRLDKLGVKAGVTVRLQGEFDAEFAGEISASGAQAVAKRPADLVFLAARKTADLRHLAKAAKVAKEDGALWVVYPKGIPDIREIEVLNAGRAAGLKDVKVATFSPTHTALKFVIPLADRAKGGK